MFDTTKTKTTTLPTPQTRHMLAVLALLLVFSPRAHAGEGMFLLDRLPTARLKKSGLKIPVAELQRLSRAVVIVGRGGTGSFVSPRGLVVTNHHVAYGCLVRLNARKQHQGIMDRGYLARTQKDELPCPGYMLRALVKMEDVTTRVLQGLAVPNRRNYKKRFESLRLRKEKLRQQCEASKKHICEVASMNGGTSYYLSTYRRIRDVRLVYAPPKSLGKYGGDIDNWMYPRHTADFTFLRGYVTPDGAGAAYARTNVPLSSPVFLKVSPHGVKRGSLVMVMGFPGHTSRHRTSHAVRFYEQQRLSSTIEMLGRALTTLNQRRAASKDARRKYMGLESGLQNAIKYYRMSKKGFARWEVLKRKLAWEEALLSGKGGELEGRPVPRLDKKAARQARKLHQQIGKIYAGYYKLHRRFMALARISGWVLPSLRTAHDIVKWSIEKQKSDIQRKDGRYKDKNVFRFKEAAERLEQEMEIETEKALLLFFLREMQKLPRAQRPTSMTKLEKRVRAELAALARKAREARTETNKLYLETYGVPRARDPLQLVVDVLYGRTTILARSADKKEITRAVALRQKLFETPAKALVKLDDPLLTLARDVEAEMRMLREGPLSIMEQYLASALRPRWVKEFARAPYPDANFTIRLTYGSVQDYHESATGKTHRYLTDLSGLLKKDRGKYPFTVPESLRKAFPQRLKSRHRDRQIADIPVNFTSTLDTTGGNSGSPVLDDKGRLVGLLFDGTPESILSDWQYLHRQQRSICMDIRFASYLGQVRGAERVLEEIGIK